MHLVHSGEIRFDKFMRGPTTRNAQILKSMPLTEQFSKMNFQQEAANNQIKSQFRKSQQVSTIFENNASRSVYLSLDSSLSSAAQPRQHSLLLANSDIINQHLSRALSINRSLQVPLPPINLQETSRTLESNDNLNSQFSSADNSPKLARNQVTDRLHQRGKVQQVNSIVEKRLQKNSSFLTSSLPSDRITQTSLFQLFSERVEGPLDRHAMMKSLTSGQRKQKKSKVFSQQFTTRQPSSQRLYPDELSQEKKLRIAQVLLAKRKIEVKAQRIEDESLLNDKEHLRKILHGCVRTGSNVAKNDKPIRHFFKSSDTQKKVEFIRKMTQKFSGSDKEQKYQGLGELGEYYARKEKLEEKLRQDQTVKCMIAAQPKPTANWTRDEVVAKMKLPDQERQQMYMIEARKDWSPTLEQNKDFIEKVNSYVVDLQNNLPEQQQSQTFDSMSNLALRKSLSRLEPKSPRSKNNATPTSPTMAKLIKRLSTQTSITIDQLSDRFGTENKQFDLQQVTDYLLGRVGFQQLCKTTQANPSVMNELLGQDSRQSYFLKCKDAIEPALDVLSKISDKHLYLEEYTMGLGQCKGFMSACLLEPELLTHITIDNCGLKDNSLYFILKGLVSQRKIIRITLKRIQIGQESVEQLGQLLSKVKPKQLEELRIEKCQIQVDALTCLIEGMCKDSQLQKLYLVGQELLPQHVKLLQWFIKASMYLMLIDISWSRVKHTDLLGLLRTISENTKLQYVDISHNSLAKNANYGSFGQINQLAPVSQAIESSQVTQSKNPEKGNLETKKDVDNDLEIQESLKRLLSQNKKLLHLNLSNLGLSEKVLLDLIGSIQKSQSLVGLHLSGNPGLTQAVYQAIIAGLSATYEEPLALDSFNQVLKRNESESDKISKKNFTQALQIKKILWNQKVDTFQAPIAIEIPQDRQLILTRVLGHHIEMIGAQNWQVSRRSGDCWICNRSIYTLFFWSPEIGRVDGGELNLTAKEKLQLLSLILTNRQTNEERKTQRTAVPINLVKPIKRRVFNKASGAFVEQDSSDMNSSIYSDSEEDEVLKIQSSVKQTRIQTDGPSIVLPYERYRSKLHGKTVPMLFGQFNNWQPQPMIPIARIAEVLDPNPINILDELKGKGQLRKEVFDPKDMDRREGQLHKKRLDDYLDNYLRPESWTKAIQKLLVYNQPHCSALSLLKIAESKNLFIGASFVKCGKQDYVVQHGAKFYFHSTIAAHRREEIAFPKVTETIVGKKERNPNVFKHWTHDNAAVLKACINCDFQNWKLAHFVKDTGDQNEVKTIIIEHYEFLKDVYLTVSCHSDYPSIASADFIIFAHESELVDTNLTVGIIETQFIASRVDVDKKNHKVPNQNLLNINRFEFLECLVRIANCRYKQSQGAILTLGQALTQVIEQIRLKFQLEPSQSFRKDFLWTREVNLVLDANKKGISDLYDQLCTNNKFGRISLEVAMQLMTQLTKIKLTEKDARACYGLSQQTCTDIVTQGNLRLNHLDLLEFTELIARVADRYFSEEELFLHTKIEYVLDEWLRVVGQLRRDPIYFQREDAETSD